MTENWGPDRSWRWWRIVRYWPLAVWSARPAGSRIGFGHDESDAGPLGRNRYSAGPGADSAAAWLGRAAEARRENCERVAAMEN